MSQTVKLTNYYTRNQIRNVVAVGAPAEPTVAVLVAGGTYIDLAVTAPATPLWASAQAKYIVGYTISYTGSNGHNGSLYLPAGATLRLQPLVQGVEYQISVSATDCLGLRGLPSASVSATTAANTAPPAQPSIKVTPLSVGVRIDVSPYNLEPDFAGYDLYHDTNAAVESEPPALLPTASFRGISFKEQAFSADGNYYFFLRAKNYSGLHADSPVVGPVAVVAPPNTTPAPISMATATATANADGSITLVYPASADPTLSSYNIYRQVMTNSMSGWVQIGTNPAGTTAYNDQSTIDGLTYQYSVSVVTPGGESTYDTLQVVKAIARDAVAPSVPLGNLTYVGKRGGVQIGWDASPDPTTAGYVIRWRYAQAGQYSTFNEGEQVVGTSYILDGLLDPATGLAPTRDSLANEFEVEIASIDSNGNRSAFVARTDAGGGRRPVEYPELNGYQPADSNPPIAPALNAPVLNPDSTVTVSWQATGAPTQAGFLIEKQANYVGSGISLWESLQPVTDTTAGTKQYTVTGLEPFKFRGTTYRFRVRELDTSGNISSANLLENPTFASGLASWGGSAATTSSGYGGNPGVKASNAASASQSVGVTAGDVYTLSAYYAQDITAGATAVLSVEWFNGATSLGTKSIQGVVAVPFQRVVITAQAPAGATSILVTLSSTSASTVIWSESQLEQRPIVTAYGDSKTAWLSAVDTNGPNTAGYAPNFTVKPDFGCFHLNWNNGTDSTFFNCTYEIWRQNTVSTEAGFTPDASMVKIHETPGTSDGKAVQWSDLSPTIENKVTAVFAIRVRDRFGCAAVDGSNNPVFTATYAAQTSLDLNDKKIVTTDPGGGIGVGGPGAGGSAGAQPTLFKVYDDQGNVIGEIGKLTGSGPWGGQYGGWFARFGVGSSDPSTAKLWIDNQGGITGANGTAIDILGNVGLKNKVTAVCASNASYLTSTPTEIPNLGFSSNADMSIPLKGNPCMLGLILNFSSQSGGGGQCTSLNWTPSNCTNAGSAPQPPSISITFSGGGGGSGTTAGVSWTAVFGNGAQSPPTGFNSALNFNGGSGYTSAPTAIININIPDGCTYDGHNGPYSYQVTSGCSISAPFPVSGADVEVSVLMDGNPISYKSSGGNPITLLGTLTLLTNNNGQAYDSRSLMTPLPAGNHTFQVRASTQTPSNNIQTGTCVFMLVELG